MVMGDHLGRRRILLLDTAANLSVAYLLLPDFHGFYASIDTAYPVEGRALRRHVGRGQRKLRAHHAPSGDLPGSRRGHWRDAGGGHADASDAARAGCNAVHDQRRPVHHGWRVGGADGRGHCLLCRPSERDATERRTQGVQSEAGTASGRALRHLFLGHGLCHRRGGADESRGASPGRESALCGAAELCVYHGRRRGCEYELLLHPPGCVEEAFPSRAIYLSPAECC